MQAAGKAYDEIVDLFARGCSPDKILDYRPSAGAQRRASFLLEQNRRGALKEEEAAELERLGQLEHLMQLVKARARFHAGAGS